LFKLDRGQKRGLQNQLQDKISTAILEGQIPADTSIPIDRIEAGMKLIAKAAAGLQAR